jgi:hypothetical protein
MLILCIELKSLFVYFATTTGRRTRLRRANVVRRLKFTSSGSSSSSEMHHVIGPIGCSRAIQGIDGPDELRLTMCGPNRSERQCVRTTQYTLYVRYTVSTTAQPKKIGHPSSVGQIGHFTDIKDAFGILRTFQATIRTCNSRKKPNCAFGCPKKSLSIAYYS